MMPAGFFFLLFLTGGNTSGLEPQEFYDDQQASNHSSEETSGGNSSSLEPPDKEISEHSEDHCTFKYLLDHLKLTANTELYTVGRPVKKYYTPTVIYLHIKIFAILDVKVADQIFVSYIWTYLKWHHEHAVWDPKDFCDFDRIIVPTKLLWMPDLTIEEMINKEKSDLSPFLSIQPDGWVDFRYDMVLNAMCKMYVYKFPFDSQSCSISFKSMMYSDAEVHLFYNPNYTKGFDETLYEEFEWLFVNQTVSSHTVNDFGYNQTLIVFSITMKRRSVLYAVNFLLPVLLFLCLDLASFLISDTGGEKIGFKVTVLLAVTVMQLILHEILPSSSNKIPLIALYCMGIFSLMLLSLLETILVVYLLEKDSASKDNETEKDQSLNEDKHGKAKVDNYFREEKKCCDCGSMDNVSADETPSMAKEGSSSQLIEVSLALEKVSDELAGMEKAITKLSSRKEEVKPGCWTSVVKKINKVFLVFYITAATGFLTLLFSVWFSPEVTTE